MSEYLSFLSDFFTVIVGIFTEFAEHFLEYQSGLLLSLVGLCVSYLSCFFLREIIIITKRRLKANA